MAPFLIGRSCGSFALAALELWGHRPHGSEVVGARAPTAPMAPTPLSMKTKQVSWCIYNEDSKGER